MKRWMLILTMMILAGCRNLPTGGQLSPVETPAEAQDRTGISPIVTPASGPLDSIRSRTDLPQAAIADLAERLSVDPAAIVLERVEADEFPAQGLGCPNQAAKGGGADQPAFVTGQSIWLRVGDALYEYHSHGTQLVFCGMQQE